MQKFRLMMSISGFGFYGFSVERGSLVQTHSNDEDLVYQLNVND